MRRGTKEIAVAAGIALVVTSAFLAGGLLSALIYHFLALLAGAGGTMLAITATFRRVEWSTANDTEVGRAVLLLRNVLSFTVTWLLALSVFFASPFLFGLALGAVAAIALGAFLFATPLLHAHSRVHHA